MTFERETKEFRKGHEEGKDEQNDESMEFYIGRHKINKEYEQDA